MELQSEGISAQATGSGDLLLRSRRGGGCVVAPWRLREAAALLRTDSVRDAETSQLHVARQLPARKSGRGGSAGLRCTMQRQLDYYS